MQQDGKEGSVLRGEAQTERPRRTQQAGAASLGGKVSTCAPGRGCEASPSEAVRESSLL